MSRVALSLAVAAALAGADDNRDDVVELGVDEVVGSTIDDDAPAKPETLAADRNARDVTEALAQLPGVVVQNIGARSERLVYVRRRRRKPRLVDRATAVAAGRRAECRRYAVRVRGRVSGSGAYVVRDVRGALLKARRRPVAKSRGRAARARGRACTGR